MAEYSPNIQVLSTKTSTRYTKNIQVHITSSLCLRKCFRCADFKVIVKVACYQAEMDVSTLVIELCVMVIYNATGRGLMSIKIAGVQTTIKEGLQSYHYFY